MHLGGLRVKWKVRHCCRSSNSKILKVDSRKVLTIFWVGIGIRPTQLRYFTWLHWLVVCHWSGLKIDCCLLVKIWLFTGCGHGIVIPLLKPSLNIRTCAAPKFHSKFCQECENQFQKFLEQELAKISQFSQLKWNFGKCLSLSCENTKNISSFPPNMVALQSAK